MRTKPSAVVLAAAVILSGSLSPVQAGHWWRPVRADDIALELPMNRDAAAQQWKLPEGFALVEDETLGRSVWDTGPGKSLLLSRRPCDGAYEITLLLQIPKRASYAATLYCGVRNLEAMRRTNFTTARRESAYALMTTDGSHFYPYEGQSSARDLLPPTDAEPASKAKTLNLRPRFKNTSPVWDEDQRVEIESVIDANPSLEDRWSRLRVVVRGNRVVMYADEFCLGEFRPALDADGYVAVSMNAQVRIGELTVRRLAPERAAFHPVDITARLNAREIDADDSVSVDPASLPVSGQAVTVEDVPFIFPDRSGDRDHIDIGKSLFHYRKTINNPNMNTLWPAPTDIDAGRIMFTVPNRAYSRAWIVAAADDDQNSVPLVTVRFVRPHAGFTVDAASTVPGFTAWSGRSAHAQRLRVEDTDGKGRNLWLIPVDLDSQAIVSEQREHPVLTVELTKEVHPYRNFPDPCDYGYFQGGPPSAARIYAITFEEAPLTMLASGNRAGNAYVQPETPVWQIRFDSHRDCPIEGTLTVTVTDPYGTVESTIEKPISIPAQGESGVDIPIDPALLGFYRVRSAFRATSGLERGEPVDYVQSDAFVQVPPDTRKTNQTNSRWGFWNWRGGHGTNPNTDENAYLMRACGARGAMSDLETRKKWGLFPWAKFYRAPAWVWEDPYDPQAYTNYSKEMGENVLKFLEDNPDQQYICYFAENSVSLSATYGTYPEYIGEGERAWTEQEQKTIRGDTLAIKSAFEGIRKAAPQVKLTFGWCAPQFIVPFLRNQFPKELFDAIGLDVPTFERMPEAPAIDVNPNKMWFLQEELKKNGYPKIPIIHSESYFPTSHELALGHRVSADYYVRTSVLSLALGTTRMIASFSLFDCSNYWGAQHYGCIGVVGRRPEYNPKPAFAAYATMTRLLDLVEFDGYVPAGSISTYCVRFKNLDRSLPHKYVYCLWTLRGTRDATVQFGPEGTNAVAVKIDENGNETPLDLSTTAATVTLTQTPIWITSDLPMERVEPGPPTYPEAPGPHTLLLDPLDTAWTYDRGDYPSYSQAYPVRFITYPGPMQQAVVNSPERGVKVWQVALQTPGTNRPFAGWFGVFRPPAPIEIPGKASALGVWANGASDWGRIVYELRDAKGETFLSVGMPESWNSNDNYHRSYFNFDGWRYIEFPLPNNLPGDDYREKDSVWWGHDAEGIVDLPVTLTRIIIEHRTDNVYVNDLVPASNTSVELDELIAVYDSPEMMTDTPVALQRAAAVTFTPGDGSSLPNPLADLAAKSEIPATVIEKFYKPETWYDGKQIMIQIKGVEGAKEYRVYVSSYESGAGAAVLAKGAEPVMQVTRLRPEYPLFFAVTYVNEAGKESKPSAVRRLVLKDDFPNK